MTEQALRVTGTPSTSAAARLLERVGLRVATPAAPVTYTPGLVATVGAVVLPAAGLAVWRCRGVADWSTLALLGLLVAGMACTSVRREGAGQHFWNATILLHLGMTFTLGPTGALMAATMEAVGAAVRVRNGWFRVCFNVSNMLLSDLAALWVYQTFDSRHVAAKALLMSLGGLTAGAANWVVNNGLVLAVVVASQGRRAHPAAFVAAAARHLPYSVAYGYAALAFTTLFTAWGLGGVLMAAVPIVAAQGFFIRWAHQERALREEERAHVADVERSHRVIQVAHYSTLIALTAALDARDSETLGHSRRVVEYSREIARELGLDRGEMAELTKGALLHDIGKIAIRDAILSKRSSLTEEEWAEMRRHPEKGAHMIEDIDALEGARRLVLHHHERWDGRGYPSGRRGLEIPRSARIFAVADAVDAMTQDRPYRTALGWDPALTEVRRGRGTQFDPEVVDAFLRLPLDMLLRIAAVRQPPRLDLFRDPVVEL